MTADVQRELAEALRDKLVETVGSQMPPGHAWNLDKVTDGLLPLIADAEKRAAARELRAAADDHWAKASFIVNGPAGMALRVLPVAELYRQAERFIAALDPSGAVDGAQT